jgi:hypothetical protein
MWKQGRRLPKLAAAWSVHNLQRRSADILPGMDRDQLALCGGCAQPLWMGGGYRSVS